MICNVQRCSEFSFIFKYLFIHKILKFKKTITKTKQKVKHFTRKVLKQDLDILGIKNSYENIKT